MASVSIVIPTYNHRDFVNETLESVFAQTFTDYEVIVVNDGSPDDTATVLRPYIDSRRINYIEQKNAGQAAARNRGLAEAKGEFIAFLDDDDLWPNDHLEYQIGKISATDFAILGGAGALIENGRCNAPPVDSGEIVELDTLSIFRKCPFFSPGQVLFRRSAIEKIGGFDTTIRGVDDMDAYIRISLIGRIAKTGRCVLYYRIHSSNASRDVVSMFWNTLLAVNKNVPKLPVEHRRYAKRLGYLWAFRYAGKKAIEASLRGPERDINMAVRVSIEFAKASAYDVQLAFRLIQDLTPMPLRRLLRAALRRRKPAASGHN